MSNTRRGRKGIVVTSKKRLKTERKLNNEYGIQRARAVKIATERAEELQRAIKSSNDLHAIGAAAREAVWSETRRSEAAMASFRRKYRDIEVTITPNAEDAIEKFGAVAEGIAEEVSEFTEEPVPASVTSNWCAEDDGWMTPETGWKNAIFRLKNGVREVLNCPHKHKTPEAARACALKAAKTRNNSNAPAMDGYSTDARYPWTDGAITALIDELRAESDPAEA